MRKKKILIALLAMLTVGLCAVGVSGCDMERLNSLLEATESGESFDEMEDDWNIADIYVNENGELIILFKDGTTKNLGEVDTSVGEDNQQSGEDNSSEEEKTYSEGLEYTLSEDGTYNIVTGIGFCTDTEIIVPDIYNGLPVKEIAVGAFWECSNVTKIVIPDSVTSIGDYAFRWCENLTSIKFEGTWREWNVISKGSYWNNGVPATEVVCSDGVVTL